MDSTLNRRPSHYYQHILGKPEEDEKTKSSTRESIGFNEKERWKEKKKYRREVRELDAGLKFGSGRSFLEGLNRRKLASRRRNHHPLVIRQKTRNSKTCYAFFISFFWRLRLAVTYDLLSISFLGSLLNVYGQMATVLAFLTFATAVKTCF